MKIGSRSQTSSLNTSQQTVRRQRSSRLSHTIHTAGKTNTRKCDRFRQYDFYGQPINLHYQGYNSYTTIYGTACSIFTFGILVYLSVMGFGRIFYEWNPTITNWVTYQNMDDAFPVQVFNKTNGFDIQFGLYHDLESKQQQVDLT